jgi:hypothetical protein
VTFTGDNGTDAFGNNLHLYWVMWYDNSAYTTPALAAHPAYGRPYRRTRPTKHLLTLFNRATDSRLDASFQTVWLRAPGDTAILLTLANQTETGRPHGSASSAAAADQRSLPTLKKWLDQTAPTRTCSRVTAIGTCGGWRTLPDARRGEHPRRPAGRRDRRPQRHPSSRGIRGQNNDVT